MNSEGRKWERHECAKERTVIHFTLFQQLARKKRLSHNTMTGTGISQGKTTNHQLGVMLEETKSKIIQLLRGKFRSWQPIEDGAKHLLFLLCWWFCLVASLHRPRIFCHQPALKHRGSPWVVRVNTHSWVGSPQNPIYTIHVENQTSYYHISLYYIYILLYILYHIFILYYIYTCVHPSSISWPESNK